jgi:hypothetical protein
MKWWITTIHKLAAVGFCLLCGVASRAGEMPWVQVNADGTGFVRAPGGRPFVPWGVNYDHDSKGRLIEDYWETEWPMVEAHFAQIKQLGANVVRVHLQVGKFMAAANQPNGEALDRLAKLLGLAERLGLYLDLTGLGCYHKRDVPAWYAALPKEGRWDAQAGFWKAVAGRCADSPAVFCYDLMNEPVVPAGRRPDGDWLLPGGIFGKHFNQYVTLDPRGRPRPDIARRWVRHISAAVRAADRRHLVTVGLLSTDWEHEGVSSGVSPDVVAPDLDFVCVHLYPKSGEMDKALKDLKSFAVGKPVVIEELYPLRCSPQELDRFVDASKAHAAGWVSFYWGEPPAELRASKKPRDMMLVEWLDLFQKRAVAGPK